MKTTGIGLTIALITCAGVCARPAVAQPSAVAAAPSATSAADSPHDAGWPRDFAGPNGASVRIYAPQVDAWPDFNRITFRAAISVAQPGSDDRAYGIIKVSADTSIGREERLVVLANRKVEELSFPGTEPADAEKLKGIVTASLPAAKPQTVALDRFIAGLDPSTIKFRKADVNLAPPTIVYADTPTIAVIFMGPTRFKPVPNSELAFAINTNWDVFFDPAAQRYYLLDGKSWLTTTDVDKGPWTAATAIPSALSSLPDDDNWKDVKAAVPGVPATSVPKVLVMHAPAEVVMTDGAPAFSSVAGTGLSAVTNTHNELFRLDADSSYYLLAAGRWFKAPALSGPWAAASDSLPDAFTRLPSPQFDDVLACVPGTMAAREAAILASIPQKADVKRDVTVNVTYNGAPQFKPVQGTAMTYATNSPFSVVQAGGVYYCCSNAVWFQSPAPTGPWVVCTAVPQVIYTMPPSCPIYNVTYVQVYDSTPTSVVVGYTAGYSGATVAATGVVMFGAGLAVGAALADDCCWASYPPCAYSYGCGASYYGAYGGWVSGASCYGPYGGAGHAAWYNPATGNYGRAGYAYGPNGAAGYRTAYNPATGTSAGHAAAATPYGSWGASAVSNGSQWATASHHTTDAGTTGQAHTSGGGEAYTAQGRYGNGASVAKTANGNVYASHNGNVYENTGTGWQNANKNSSSSTSSTQPRTSSSSEATRSTNEEMEQQQQARQRGEENASRSNEFRSSGEGARRSPSSFRGGGGGGRRR